MLIKLAHFEWNHVKRLSNLEKHGIDFVDAMEIFTDDKRIEQIDDRKQYGEMRYQTIGLVNGLVLFVVYTIRHNRYRIISARRANKAESKRYYEFYS